MLHISDIKPVPNPLPNNWYTPAPPPQVLPPRWLQPNLRRIPIDRDDDVGDMEDRRSTPQPHPNDTSEQTFHHLEKRADVFTATSKYLWAEALVSSNPGLAVKWELDGNSHVLVNGEVQHAYRFHKSAGAGQTVYVIELGGLDTTHPVSLTVSLTQPVLV